MSTAGQRRATHLWRADSDPSGEPTLSEAKPSEDSGAAIAASIEREARERRTGMPRQARKESGAGIFHVMMRASTTRTDERSKSRGKACLGYALQGGGRRSQLKSKRASLRQLERLTGTFRLRYEQRMLACYAML